MAALDAMDFGRRRLWALTHHPKKFPISNGNIGSRYIGNAEWPYAIGKAGKCLTIWKAISPTGASASSAPISFLICPTLHRRVLTTLSVCRFELLVVGRQGSQGNAGCLSFRTKGSSDLDIIHLGDGPAVYCATPMLMGVICQQDKSVLEHSVPRA
ncbi:hypothetical protein HaLaN_31719, partial [Haematococcus lacustris]